MDKKESPEEAGEPFYSLSRSEDRNASVKTITTKTPKKQNLNSQTGNHV